MGVSRYQDLAAWQLANDLKRGVYALIDNSVAREDRGFCDQMRRAASSAPANLAEGFGSYRHAEFARYARIAKSSILETHNHLYDGIDRHHWSHEDVDSLLALADRAAGAVTRLHRYLASTKEPSSVPRP